MIIVPDISKAQLEDCVIQDNKQTAKAGLVIFNQTLKHFGLPQIIDQHFEKPKSNKGYLASEKIMPAILSFIGGGNTIDDMEIIRKDIGLLSACGMKRMCGADAFREFIHKENTRHGLEQSLKKLAITALNKDTKRTEYTLDTDWTFIPSDKATAKMSYKKEKGYGSLLSFVPELGITMAQDFKPGNVSPAQGILEQLTTATEIASLAGKKISRFRSDSAGHNKKIFNYCDDNTISFYISLDQNQVIRRLIDDLYEEGARWTTNPDNEQQEWSESAYYMSGYNKKALRVLVLRWKPKNPSLFDQHGYRHHVICTNNDDIQSLEWLVFHNGRMASENFNKDLKIGLELTHCPSHSLIANCNYFLIGVMSFNMYGIFKHLYGSKEIRSWSLKTFRWRFVSVSGRWLFHARKLIYRIINASSDILDYYQYVFLKLQKT